MRKLAPESQVIEAKNIYCCFLTFFWSSKLKRALIIDGASVSVRNDFLRILKLQNNDFMGHRRLVIAKAVSKPSFFFSSVNLKTPPLTSSFPLRKEIFRKSKTNFAKVELWKSDHLKISPEQKSVCHYTSTVGSRQNWH